MGKIRVHEFVTVDGSYEDPSFTAPYGFTESLGAAIGALTAPASGILLGRNTFEMFAPAWSARTDVESGAPFFNDTTKHVVSSSLTTPEDVWRNSVVLGPYDADAIRALKNNGDLYVSGSGTLVRALLADRLIDELHLFVYPVVLGTGARLFPEGTAELPLSLLASESFDNGVTHLTFGPA